MKKYFSAILLLVMTLFFSSCKTKPEEENQKPVVVSSITIINDLVKQIAKDKVETFSICDIGIDPHSYKSKPEDSRLIARADLVFVNGLGLEGWITKLIESAGGQSIVKTVSDGVDPLRDQYGHGDPDPHAWFDLMNVKIYVDNILIGLIEIDSLNKNFYTENAKKFKIELDSLHNWTKKKIKSIPEPQRVLITSHDAFRYFGKAYGIEVHGIQGISTEAKAQTSDVARLVDLIKKQNIPAVFIETSVNPKMIEQIASETNAKIGGALFSDSIGEPNSEAGTFVGAFKKNVETIMNGLSGKLK
ncbi:MAG: hypothetical protein C0425_07580 [Chlorobiaceae bacterium]|nr:hypothetical protein [Chlorobiaceae bacterium]MBA4310183.1 hypothetical protein [Chlorobiaceae bacterium]